MAGMLKGVLLLLLLVLVRRGCAAGVSQERNIITHIKGFDGRLPFSLETGYVEVGETHGVELFYYFIQSERNPAEDPLILWISGGPGCSGLSPLLFEIGPLRLEMEVGAGAEDGGFPRLVYFEDSWTKVSNVIFLDAPVGTGFSCARDAQGLKVSHTGTGRHVLIFLHKWLAQHPELASNPLYMGGGSFGGKIAAVAALEVATNGRDLNLVGYLVGNAPTSDRYDVGSRVPFMHGMGLISDELYAAARASCRGDYVSKSTNPRCVQALQAISEATSDVNQMDILEPLCDPPPAPTTQGRRSSSILEKVQEKVTCRAAGYDMSCAWANDPEVRKMLGVREGSTGSWSRCTTLRHFQYDVPSSIPYHRNLTQRGYRALVYSGDHDAYIPFVGTQAWIRTLGYPVVAPWRPWYNSNRQLAGFITQYAHNLTFATVKDAGHTPPESRPKECLEMLRTWTSSAGSRQAI